MIDRHDDQDAGRLTPAEQDQVVDECFQCKLCYINCPYIPELHEWELDFPRLMLRADAMRHANGIRSGPRQATDAADGAHRSDGQGSPPPPAPLANKIINADARVAACARSWRRSPASSAVRLLPPYASQRFSTWFKKRRPRCASPSGRARWRCSPPASSSTRRPSIGQDLVKVYERNGIECELPEGRLLRRPVAAQRRRREVHEGSPRRTSRRLAAERAHAATTSSCPSRPAATC